MTRLAFIPQQFIKVAVAHRADLNQMLVGGIHIAPGSSTGIARVWRVNLPSLTDGGELTFLNSADKDDSIALTIDDDGSVIVTWCQAAPGGGGATSQPEVVIIPGVFPPAPSAIDQPARNQANAATTMAHSALDQAAALNVRVTSLEQV